jgi:exosortase C (VPDSG-CTERM-specific)
MARTSNGTAAAETIIPAQKRNVQGPISPVHRKRWRIWIGVCFAILLIAAFTNPLLALINYAAASKLYSYILLVPFVSAYVLYLRRDQLPKNHATDVPLTLVFLVVGLAILVFTYSLDLGGRLLSVNSRIVLLTFSFLCLLATAGFFFLGRLWMRKAAFPLAYLIFTVPMPDAMADALETASKYASAEVANLLLHLSGTPFLRAGLVFQLPNITIEVAQACSGIRSSWVLFMTSILAANLFLKTPWRRFALVVFVIPLAILRNGFRILVIGLLCVNLGPQMIHSLIHTRGGPVFFTLSLIPFFLVLWWLRKGDVHTDSRNSSEPQKRRTCPS